MGLYPYISHCEGLEALRKAMEKENPKVPVRNLYNLAKLVLENNYFEFDEKVYRIKFLVQRLVLNLPLILKHGFMVNLLLNLHFLMLRSL